MLSLTIFALAAMLPLLMGNLRALARLLLATATLVLLLSYAGVILVPDLAIHQARDAVEPLLAGDWRGLYGHKNQAAAIMALFVFAGIFVARNGMVLSGSLVIAASSIFLWSSHGKSAIGLLFVALGLAFALSRLRSLAAKMIFALGPMLLLNFLTVGSVVYESAKAILKMLPIDATFTGRTDIWEFAIASIGERPLTGFGYQAFWHSEVVRLAGRQGSRLGSPRLDEPQQLRRSGVDHRLARAGPGHHRIRDPAADRLSPRAARKRQPSAGQFRADGVAVFALSRRV